MARGSSVSYLRVSTQQQGRSGLGLEAQRKAVLDYLDGGRWELLGEFVEIESGKRDDRPKLQAALTYCKITGARLVIAKLDRLSRDAHFLLGLQKAGVKFVAADLPEANEMVVGILAVVAQAERKMISDRTRAALQAAQAKGVQLGGWREAGVPCKDGSISKGSLKLGPEHREAARRVRKAASREHAQELAPTIAELRSQGITGLRRLARALAERGVLTASKKDSRWTPMQVSRVIRQLDAGK